jgi:tRNA dimethylallyltransferase
MKPAPVPDWIGLAGPTAAGKTAIALNLAEDWPLEIVSVDSALVYRGMDIGTAKPTPEERACVPHHLIDILDPAESFSAGRFVALAGELIADIRRRGRLPLLVGGTMLYFRALIDGLAALPVADPALRAEIDAEAALVGWPAMHARLAEVDPVSAGRLAANDAQRIQRALEVWRASGQTLSSLQAQGSGAPARPIRHRLIALEPVSRGWLHQRIALRFEAMLGAGLIAEVQALRRRTDLQPSLPALRCVGYRQAWEALDAGLEGTALNRQVLERGSAATRQLAKRQLTWLRSMDRISVAADASDTTDQVRRAMARAVTGIMIQA